MLRKLQSRIKTKEFWIGLLVYFGLVLSILLITDYLLPLYEQEEIVISKRFTRNFDGSYNHIKRETASSFYIETKDKSILISSTLYEEVDKGSRIKIKRTPVLGTIIYINVGDTIYDDFPSVYNYNLFLPLALFICSILSTDFFIKFTYGFFVGFSAVLFFYILGIMILNWNPPPA